MKSLKVLFTLFFLCVLLFSASAKSTSAATVIEDIQFAEIDGHKLLLDLHMPDESRPPLVVYIHGGGWKGGSRKSCHVKGLADHGFAVASISYRLTDQAIFPAQIHDCKGAIRWLRANADRLGYSVDRLVVTGSSAGGHLSALLGTSGGVKELEGEVGGNLEYSSRVDAVIDFYGPTDFILRSRTQPHRANEVGSVVYRLLGGGADTETKLASLASPVTHVTADDPPFLVFHGDQDKTVLLDQSERIADVYRKAGLPLTLRVLEGAGHGGKSFYTGQPQKETIEFLESHLRLQNRAEVAKQREPGSLLRATPESQGVESKGLLKFINQLDDVVDQIHSVMVLRNGKVITEAWWQPESADQPHILWSLSKSFTATAVGMAIEEGAFQLDDQVIKFFPDDLPGEISDNLKKMTVRNLLTMSAGHTNEPWATGGEDWTKRFLAQPIADEPGSRFRYNTPATYMLSAIISKTTGKSVRDYLVPRLFEPLEIEAPQWDQTAQGVSFGGFGLYLKTEDIAKFGQLMLDRGTWSGKRLISESWVDQATSSQIKNDREGGNPDWKQGYGFQFWQCRHHAYRGDGKDGQFCIVIPDQNLVVVMTAKTKNMQRQLNVVWDYLLPALKEGELPADRESYEQLQEQIEQLRLPNPMIERPRHIGSPDKETHQISRRRFQGIPSLAISGKGRLWANWYAGVNPGEDEHNYVVLATSGDGGKQWKEQLVIDPDGSGPIRAFDPEVWIDPLGRLWVFWAQSIGHDGSTAGVWAIRTDNADSEVPKWTAPRRIADGIMMCKPNVLQTGEWVLPVSTWRSTDHSAQMIVSTSFGRSWTLRGACNVPVSDRAFDEHMITERADGSLWLLARTRYGIGESVSLDRGESWPDLSPSDLMHPSARFFIQRLATGNLLLVKHGGIKEKTGRSHLTAFLSVDDGKSWSSGLLLDERAGVSYPDGQMDSDGKIRIIYDRDRTGDREILIATFREQDLKAGKLVAEDSQLRQVVSRIGG